MIKSMKLNRLVLLVICFFCSVGVFAQKTSKEIAITRSKDFIIAIANCDVAKVKKLMTPEFYKKSFPYSDAKVKEKFLSIPLETRKNMIRRIQKEIVASAMMNRAGDCITVTLTNQVTDREMTLQLVDASGTGDWRIFDYWN